MIDFFGVGYDAAEQMGVLPRLAERGYQIDELRYHDDTGRTRARLSYRRIADALDRRVFSIMRPDLEAVLRKALAAGVRQLFNTSVRLVADRADGVGITTTGGQTLHADLLVGADGIHSRVREVVFGPERDYLRYLGFHTAAFTFRDADVRAEVAGGVCLTESTDRQIGLYGLRGRARSRLHRAPGAGPGAVVARGSGASLAIGGAFVLARQLGRSPSIEQGLAGYERIFRPMAEEKQRLALNAVRCFLPHIRTQLLIRRAALTAARIPVFTK
jgi:2-polyprenyl-6-methoxyphenol hydroxylase-like FAD-dependent oxidoreductase